MFAAPIHREQQDNMRFTGKHPCLRSLFRPLALVALFPAAGCLQIDTTIRLNEDGSGTVTERIRFSRELLDTDRDGRTVTFASLLEENYARERCKTMGKGATLDRHTVRDAEAASREAVTVFRIPDLNDLRYTSPFIGTHRPAWDLKVSLAPQLSDDWRGWQGGDLMVNFSASKPPARPAFTNMPALPALQLPGGPLGRQAYRDIAPAFRDMLKGFRIRVAFECYGRIHRMKRGRSMRAYGRGYTSPNKQDIIHFAYEGSSGTETIDSEEVMADLLQFHIHPSEKSKTYGPFVSRRLPTSVQMAVRPSRPLFDRYFKGKSIVTGPPDGKKTYPATFERFGNRTADERRKGRKEK